MLIRGRSLWLLTLVRQVLFSLLIMLVNSLEVINNVDYVRWYPALVSNSFLGIHRNTFKVDVCAQADPQKHSVYREEAVESLVEALTAEDNPKLQVEAARALASLSGRYSSKGKSATEAALLKSAGFEDDSGHSPKIDQLSPSVEISRGSGVCFLKTFEDNQFPTTMISSSCTSFGILPLDRGPWQMSLKSIFIFAAK